MHTYLVKVGSRTTSYPEKTRRFRTARRAQIHATRMRASGYPVNIVAIKPSDNIHTHVPYADAA